VYAIYCGRGEIENRIKELKHDLTLDRASCHAFAANELRLLLTTAAFALLQILRRPLPERPRVQSLRLWLLKIGTRVECSIRRVVVHLAQNHPWRDLWRRTALALGAASTESVQHLDNRPTRTTRGMGAPPVRLRRRPCGCESSRHPPLTDGLRRSARNRGPHRLPRSLYPAPPDPSRMIRASMNAAPSSRTTRFSLGSRRPGVTAGASMRGESPSL
jgi:hypothetical protein